jgi:hypothetical protein
MVLMYRANEEVWGTEVQLQKLLTLAADTAEWSAA